MNHVMMKLKHCIVPMSPYVGESTIFQVLTKGNRMRLSRKYARRLAIFGCLPRFSFADQFGYLLIIWPGFYHALARSFTLPLALFQDSLLFSCLSLLVSYRCAPFQKRLQMVPPYFAADSISSTTIHLRCMQQTK